MMIEAGNVKSYVYPDINDALITSLIHKSEPFAGYWERSEKYILGIVKKYIQNNIPPKSSFLDAGCGDGRLICEFEVFFDKIVAVDPDANRLQVAMDTAKKQCFLNKVSFRTMAIEQLDESQKFDVILCSHVIQHVNTNNVQLILRKLKGLLKENGFMIIMTNHSKASHDQYVKAYFKNSKYVEERISEEEFNSLTCNSSRMLPIHFFSSRNIIRTLKKLNFKISEIKSFHILSNLYKFDNLIFRDRLLNCASFLRRKVGRDIFILARLVRQ